MIEIFLVVALGVSDSELITHPAIDCWEGERTWTASGKPPSDFISFDTEGDPKPFKISHNRDTFFEAGELVQDYNFIDYFFGAEEDPLQGRHYLRSDEISIITPRRKGELPSLKEARNSIPKDVLCYFKKRYSVGTVLTIKGYERLWGVAENE